MVKLCTAEYPLENNAKYHEHFDTFPFPLSDFQKYAIEGLTDTLRLELKSANIAVVLLEPGPINTQFRANALLAVQANIDIEASDHKVQYQQQIARLSSEKSNAPFTLEPLHVTQALIHALESKQPKLRYRITTATKLFAVLKRLLPARWLDYLLAKG